jgi:hypothetical protein
MSRRNLLQPLERACLHHALSDLEVRSEQDLVVDERGVRRNGVPVTQSMADRAKVIELTIHGEYLNRICDRLFPDNVHEWVLETALELFNKWKDPAAQSRFANTLRICAEQSHMALSAAATT